MNGCKMCPAFSKCTATYRGSACAALRSSYGIDDDPEIKTNADRIRAMGENELAEFLSYAWDVTAKAWMSEYGETLYWLQQPTEEDNNAKVDR